MHKLETDNVFSTAIQVPFLSFFIISTGIHQFSQTYYLTFSASMLISLVQKVRISSNERWDFFFLTNQRSRIYLLQACLAHLLDI